MNCSPGVSALVLNQPVDLLKAGLGKIPDHHVGAALAEFALVVFPGDANDEGEASPSPGLDPGNGVLNHDCAQAGHAHVCGRSGEDVRLGLALEPEPL